MTWYTGHPHSPQVTWRTEDYSTNNVTVILEWVQEPGVSYNVSVVPDPLKRKVSQDMNQLTILYNTSYSVVVFATLCGQNMNMTIIDISMNSTGESYVLHKLRLYCLLSLF